MTARASETPRSARQGKALQWARRTSPMVAAGVLGLLIANLSVIATFLVFNFILHWGS
ncbi:hypothetical protein [Aquabacterium sp. J223]|uniref:hypothetical protein n=1 Tax=Aquabacterium sp. J223 TaxID=2898431 RepID=UPI0021ADD140|nr:hypothetical protein [Aquabacterium sp. J223]UUX94804.1 hypothetical protein LRS07_16180 [Aquabacterium sp. J223]